MDNLWKKAISNLRDELSPELYSSLLELSKPRQLNHSNNQNLFEIELSNRNLLHKISPSLKSKIEKNLKGVTGTDFIIHFSSSVSKSAPVHLPWLNPDFRFDTFLQGQSNQLACLAAEAIAMQPGRSNPFYIYGEPGMGKTHLIHAMVHEIQKQHPQKKIYYNSFADFKEAFNDSLAKRTVLEYKKSLREYDILIIENIEELSSAKKSICDEFFNVFNVFYDQSRQIIFSANVAASYLNLRGSLKSRLLSGLQVELLAPDEKLTKALIFDRVQTYGLKLKQPLLQKLLSYKPGSIRELESIMNRLYFLKEKGIKVQNVAQIQKNFIELFNDTDDPVFSIENIVDTVCKKYRITKEQILSNSRKAEFTLPRHIAMYLAVKHSDLNKSAIARYFRKSDHTTVINAEKNISRRIQKEKGFRQTLEQIVNQLRIKCG